VPVRVAVAIAVYCIRFRNGFVVVVEASCLRALNLVPVLCYVLQYNGRPLLVTAACNGRPLPPCFCFCNCNGRLLSRPPLHATATASAAACVLQRPPPWPPSASSLCPLGTTVVPPCGSLCCGPSLVVRVVAATGYNIGAASCSPPFSVLCIGIIVRCCFSATTTTQLPSVAPGVKCPAVLLV
jgi:hypothetical protein